LDLARVKWLLDRTVRPLATPETAGAFDKGMRLLGIEGGVSLAGPSG